MAKMEVLKKELTAFLKNQGAGLVGVGSLEGIISGEWKTGISVAIPEPRHIIRQLQTAPTREYLEEYRLLDQRLDEIVLCGEQFLREQGFQAVANTMARMTKDEEWRTVLPHKTVATRAGLGWIGKSCLLVTETFGSAVRISSLLTDAHLPADMPVTESKCKDCTICVERCPAGVLTGALWEPSVSREELFDRFSCRETQICLMEEATGIATDLCGICFAFCPYTLRYLNGENGERTAD